MQHPDYLPRIPSMRIRALLLLVLSVLGLQASFAQAPADPARDETTTKPVMLSIAVTAVDPVTERAVVRIDGKAVVMHVDDVHDRVTLKAVSNQAALEVRNLDGSTVGLRLAANQQRALRLDREPDAPTPIAIPLSEPVSAPKQQQ